MTTLHKKRRNGRVNAHKFPTSEIEIYNLTWVCTFHQSSRLLASRSFLFSSQFSRTCHTGKTVADQRADSQQQVASGTHHQATPASPLQPAAANQPTANSSQPTANKNSRNSPNAQSLLHPPQREASDQTDMQACPLGLPFSPARWDCETTVSKGNFALDQSVETTDIITFATAVLVPSA
jgi:hypothetical protein